MSDIQSFENYSRTDGIVEVEGVRVSDPRSRSPLMSASRQLEPGDIASNRSDSVLATIQAGGTEATFRELKSTPNSRRPGAMRPSIGDRDNRPMIQVVGNGTTPGTNVVIGTFTEWILENVQEQEAEKTSVVETFGQPHLFAAGRFARKFVFTGKVRAAPMNYASRDVAARMPQAVLLRKFYEDYLRMTQQLSNRRFTRITVDGDVYDGFVTTLNLSRTSTTEHLTDFMISMVGLRRGHAELDAAASALLRQMFGAVNTPIDTYDETKATYELEDSYGQLTLSVGGEDDSRLKSHAIQVSIPKDQQESFPQPIARLYAQGTPQVLTVTASRPGVALVYATATPSQDGAQPSFGADASKVHGSLVSITPEGFPGRLVQLRIADYRALFDSLVADGTNDTDTVTGSIIFRIQGATTDVVTITYTVSLSGRLAIRVNGGSVTYTNNNVRSDFIEAGSGTTGRRLSTGSRKNYRTAPVTGFTDASPGAIANGNLLPLQFDIALQDDSGKPIPDSALASPSFSVGSTLLLPATGDLMTAIAAGSDQSKIQPNTEISSVAAIAGKSSIRVTGLVRLQCPTDLRDKTLPPFANGDVARIDLFFSVSVPGYTGAVTGVIQLGVKFLNPPKSFFSKISLVSENLSRTLGLGQRMGTMVFSLGLKDNAKVDQGLVTSARGIGAAIVQFGMMPRSVRLPLNGVPTTINWTSTVTIPSSGYGVPSIQQLPRSAKLSIAAFYTSPANPTFILNIEMTSDGPKEYDRFLRNYSIQLDFPSQTAILPPEPFQQK